jgi:hypothetical protein
MYRIDKATLESDSPLPLIELVEITDGRRVRRR